MENENLDLEVKPAGNKDLWLFLIIVDIVLLCVFGFFLYKHFSASLFQTESSNYHRNLLFANSAHKPLFFLSGKQSSLRIFFFPLKDPSLPCPAGTCCHSGHLRLRTGRRVTSYCQEAIIPSSGRQTVPLRDP